MSFFRQLLAHKAVVWKVGRPLGVAWWRLLLHDLTLLLPGILWPYARHAARGGPLGGPSMAYERARQRHHWFEADHWEHWITSTPDGQLVALPMDGQAMRLMWADWEAHARALALDGRAFYLAHRDLFKLHPQTRAATDAHFGVPAQQVAAPAYYRLATN